MAEKDNKTVTRVFPIIGMQCAACSARIDRVLRKQDGVCECAVNLAANNVTLTYDITVTSPERLSEMVSNMGFQLIVSGADEAKKEVEEREKSAYKELKRNVICSIVLKKRINSALKCICRAMNIILTMTILYMN